MPALDVNECMKNGQLARILIHPDLDMKDVAKSRSNTEGPKTFVRESRQIDGACIILYIEISASYLLLFYFGLRDHI